VKAALLFPGLAAFAALTEGSELNRDSVFDSVDGFVTDHERISASRNERQISVSFYDL